ncbi:MULTISPECIES: heme exporter protein CcmD [unclassified Agarivorans]|uniref:heme exporter protein CcmD n=1 Tax=unclassified Agarivorans TaxID=2636026 RepID=UPI003D7EFD67
MMQFDSVADFFAMGGYAYYVWLAYGVSALAMGALVIDSLIKRRAIIKSVTHYSVRRKRVQAAKEMSEHL